jgi:hypothetical protein
MQYFVDTEFNGFGGNLLSLALVRDDGESLYLIYEHPDPIDPWVEQHVMPHIYKIPDPKINSHVVSTPVGGARRIAEFLYGDTAPVIITDWPDDIRYFCQAVITGPGMMVNIPRLIFDMVRVDAYPTTLENAIHHHAWWDAMALRELFRKK